MSEKLTMKEDLGKLGYSQEEAYFYKLNKELLESRRRRLDAERAAMQLENQRQAHWMRCPKCGGTMETVDLMQINVERCARCHGTYMDQGELETLFQAKESKTLLNRIKKVFATNREIEPGMF